MQTWNCFFEPVSSCPLPPLDQYVCWNSPKAEATKVVVVGQTPKSMPLACSHFGGVR